MSPTKYIKMVLELQDIVSKVNEDENLIQQEEVSIVFRCTFELWNPEDNYK